MTAADRGPAEMVETGRQLSLPREIVLPAIGRVTLERLLRHLPGRRSVFLATLDGRRVVVKLFGLSRRARAEWQHERDGLLALARHGLPAPALLADGEQEGGFLIMEFLGGTPGRDVFPVGQPVDEALLRELLRLVVRMWDAGVEQGDIHLDNFVHGEGGDWQLLDVGGMRFSGKALPVGRRSRNLALLLAQFSPLDCDDPFRCSAGIVDEAVLTKARTRIGPVRRRRLEKMTAKARRNCTEFSVVERPGCRAFIRNDHARQMLAMLDSGLDALIGSGDLLKDGTSTTVARVETAEGIFVVKRYNVKNWRKAISRQLSSHATNAWESGVLLRALGLATPAPLMHLQVKRLGWVSTEYLVTGFVEGEALPEVLGEHGKLPTDILDQLARFFCAMRRGGFSHGDTKWTNFVVTPTRELQVIDLDGLRRRVAPSKLGSLVDAQRQRFLRNWPFAAARMQEIDAALDAAEKRMEGRR